MTQQYNEEEEDDEDEDEEEEGVYDDEEDGEDDEDYVHDEGTFYTNHDNVNNAQFDRTVSNGRHNEGLVGNSDDNFLHIAKGWQGRGVSEKKVHEEVHISHLFLFVCVRVLCMCDISCVYVYVCVRCTFDQLS